MVSSFYSETLLAKEMFGILHYTLQLWPSAQTKTHGWLLSSPEMERPDCYAYWSDADSKSMAEIH